MAHISLGMDLIEWYPEAVTGTTEADGAFQASRAWRSEAPGVCVLPRFSGEKPRATWPAILTRWARGISFPQSAASPTHLGRVPAWLAWLGLQPDVVDPRWQHHYADEKPASIPCRSILRAYADALYATERRLPSRSMRAKPALHVIAMPEHFQERAQENLLAGLPRDRGDVRLLWHSVATCLAWIATLNPQLRARNAGKRVAVVDVGLSEVSAAILELRDRACGTQTFLVPKRGLPESGSSCRWPIIPFDMCLAAELVEPLGGPLTLSKVWQAVCGGATGAVVQEPPEAAREAVTLIETDGGWRKLDLSPSRLTQALTKAALRQEVDGLEGLWREVRDAVPGLELSQDATPRLLAQVLEQDVGNWLCDRPGPPNIVLLTGPVVRLLVAPDETLGARMADGLRVTPGCKIFASGRDLPPTVTAAHGCAIYGGRELAGLPTYLDTLPRFCLVGKDRLRWKDVCYDLVPGSECEGGKEYQPGKDELERLRNAAKIPEGRRHVRFRLLRQNREKQLEQDFEQAPLRDCLLSFDVRLRPAQGFARVRILPEQADLFGGREVILDWDRMKEAESEPEGPPDFPPCTPLEPNVWRIENYAAPVIIEYVEAVSAERWTAAAESLTFAGRQLQSGGTYGSDPDRPEIDRLLKALDRHHQRYVKLNVYEAIRARGVQQRATALAQVKDLMRAATGLFNRTPPWAHPFLEEQFRVAAAKNPEDPNPTPVFLNAGGRCFSSARQVQSFVHCFDLHLHKRVAASMNTGRSPGMNNWCKAFQVILRLHDEAVLHFEREQAESLARGLSLLVDAVQPTDRRRVRAPYKHAVFCVYFLLRFRARSDGADFLGDWDRKGTVAEGIHQNLSRHRNVGATSQTHLLPVDSDKTTQAVLLRFLESKATPGDIIIMKEAHDAVLGEDGDEAGEDSGGDSG